MSFAASILDTESRRKMEVFTEEPVLVFYGGNFLNGKNIGKYGKSFKYREAFCLETQHYPDLDIPAQTLPPIPIIYCQ